MAVERVRGALDPWTDEEEAMSDEQWARLEHATMQHERNTLLASIVPDMCARLDTHLLACLALLRSPANDHAPGGAPARPRKFPGVDVAPDGVIALATPNGVFRGSLCVTAHHVHVTDLTVKFAKGGRGGAVTTRSQSPLPLYQLQTAHSYLGMALEHARRALHQPRATIVHAICSQVGALLCQAQDSLTVASGFVFPNHILLEDELLVPPVPDTVALDFSLRRCALVISAVSFAPTPHHPPADPTPRAVTVGSVHRFRDKPVQVGEVHEVVVPLAGLERLSDTIGAAKLACADLRDQVKHHIAGEARQL